jgi:hypothetical protein
MARLLFPTKVSTLAGSNMETLEKQLRPLQLAAGNKEKQQVSELSVHPCAADTRLDSWRRSRESFK